MLKIGLIGSEYLIEKHLELLKNQSNFEVFGYVDAHQHNTSYSSNFNSNFKKYSIDELLHNVDVVYLFSLPEKVRTEILLKCIKQTKHLLIDKSNIKNAIETKQLLLLSEEAGVIVQVCNLAFYSSIFKAAQQHIFSASYIEATTHVHYKNNSSNAIFDLLCDDLSIILTTVKANIRKIFTVGVERNDAMPKLMNIILEFDNGCVANITINTIAEEDKKMIRFFENNSSLLLDFLEDKIILLQHNELTNKTKYKEIKLQKTSEFEQEIRALYDDLTGQKKISLDLHSTLKMHEVFLKIEEKLRINLSFHQD